MKTANLLLARLISFIEKMKLIIMAQEHMPSLVVVFLFHSCPLCWSKKVMKMIDT